MLSRSGERSKAASEASVRQAEGTGRRALAGDRPTANCSIWVAPAAAAEDGDPDRVDAVPFSRAQPLAAASLTPAVDEVASAAEGVGDSPGFRRRRFGRRCWSEAALSGAIHACISTVYQQLN